MHHRTRTLGVVANSVSMAYNNCSNNYSRRRRRCALRNVLVHPATNSNSILLLLLFVIQQVDISYSALQILSTAQTALLLSSTPLHSNNNKLSNVPSILLATSSNRHVNGLYTPVRDPTSIPTGFARMCNKAGGYAPRPIWEELTNGLTPWFEQTSQTTHPTQHHHPSGQAHTDHKQQQKYPKMKTKRKSISSSSHGSSESNSNIVLAGSSGGASSCYMYYNTNDCHWYIDDTYGYGLYLAKPTDSLLLPPLVGWVSFTGTRCGVPKMMFVE